MESANIKFKSRDYVFKICKIVYCLGAPNYWLEDFKVSRIIQTIHDSVSKFIDVLVYIFILSEFGALFTQHNLTEKQNSDLKLFCFCHPLLFSYVSILEHNQVKLRYIVVNLAVKLKDVYEDDDVGKQMIRKANTYISVYLFFMSSAVFQYGLDGVVEVLTKDATFNAVFTIWPDVEDRSELAGYTRVISYFLLWLFIIRLDSAFITVITITIALSHQYKNLRSYFLSLRDIFKNERISQEEKERQYEEGFIVGIDMHAETLRCTKICEDIFHGIYGGQILVNCVLLILLMSQMLVSERTMSNTVTTLMTVVCLLINTGCFFWNAGDVTIEASHLPTAMFNSGWHHCKKQAAERIKPLLVIAMARSQKPVVLRCFGFIHLSYATYLSVNLFGLKRSEASAFFKTIDALDIEKQII